MEVTIEQALQVAARGAIQDSIETRLGDAVVFLTR